MSAEEPRGQVQGSAQPPFTEEKQVRSFEDLQGVELRMLRDLAIAADRVELSENKLMTLMKNTKYSNIDEKKKKILRRFLAAESLAIFTDKEKKELAALLAADDGKFSNEKEADTTSLLEAAKEKVGLSEKEREDIRAHRADMDQKLTGLAFSGGGIRSATFNLGVLQALAERGLLTRFDYLSTVSGGGYIGSWLSAWIRREQERIELERRKPEQESDRAEGKGAKITARIMNYGRTIWSRRRFEQASEDGKLGVKDLQDAAEAAATVQQILADSADACSKKGGAGTEFPGGGSEKEPIQITFLRRFSNYLTPKLGLLSYDTLAAVATYIRNFLLNQTILVLALVFMLLLPRAVAYVGNFINPSNSPYNTNAFWFWCVAGFLIAIAVGTINLNLMDQQRKRKVVQPGEDVPPYGDNPPRKDKQHGEGEPCYVRTHWVVLFAAVPLVLAAMIVGFLVTVPLEKCRIPEALQGFSGVINQWWQGHFGYTFNAQCWQILGTGILAVCVLSYFAARLWHGKSEIKSSTELKLWSFIGLMSGILVTVGLLWFLQWLVLDERGRPQVDRWEITVWGVPAVLGIFGLASNAQIGITGRLLNEGSREWWARLWGVLTGFALTWIIVAVCAIYGPYWMIRLRDWVADSVAAMGIVWIISTVAGALTAASAYTGKQGSKKLIEIVPKVAPYIFIAGLLLAVSYALYLGLATAVTDIERLRVAAEKELHVDITSLKEAAYASAWWRYSMVLDASSFLLSFTAGLLISLVAALILSWRVDINVFSLHRFYLNRLERCYLGASNPNRRGNPFTGFDPGDYVRLDKLLQRPYHIVNTAINLTRTKRLAWQERKAASFMLTPLYCGYYLEGGKDSVVAYQRTSTYGARKDDWIGLAMAFSISGAAFSPNMGYHSTPAVAFLLTMFNLRLGLWMENPFKERYWKSSRWFVGLGYLLRELFGATDEKKKFVYLSDGGHFENLGIYELVRRRCRYIVVCDASMDKSYTFEDLGNAVRKCRVDLGIPIEIDTSAIIPDVATGKSRFHCAIGKIHYEHAYPLETPGYLLYVKSSLTGSEPVDVKHYASTHGDFPHEPTPDQWFAESQFESYRRLGYKVAHTVFSAANDATTRDMETLFESLKQQWYPPSSSTQAAFSKHGDQLKLLQDTLRKDENLKFLDAQLFPEWPTLMRGAEHPMEMHLWLPPTCEERRSGFYFCSSLMQLMENVYLDLNLQAEHDHPDNRGWMNLFRHWSWSGMFRVTYAIKFSTYGARFQQFCCDRFTMSEGEIEVGSEIQLPEPSDSVLIQKTAEASGAINFLEMQLIGKFLTPGRVALKFDCIIPLRLCVRNPMKYSKNEECGIQYEVGFALARKKEKANGKEIVYFRIQDHLRNSGLAGKFLNKMYEAGYAWVSVDVEHGEKTPYQKYLESMTPEDLKEFSQRYGHNPDAFKRLKHSAEKKGHLRSKA